MVKRKTDIETGREDCCCCSAECWNGFGCFMLALVLSLVLAGIAVGVVALFDYITFGDPFHAGPDTLPPGFIPAFVILQVALLGIVWVAGGLGVMFYSKNKISASITCFIATTIFFIGFVFMLKEGWNYNWFNMGPK
jgi:hypothetical protein